MAGKLLLPVFFFFLYVHTSIISEIYRLNYQTLNAKNNLYIETNENSKRYLSSCFPNPNTCIGNLNNYRERIYCRDEGRIVQNNRTGKPVVAVVIRMEMHSIIIRGPCKF